MPAKISFINKAEINTFSIKENKEKSLPTDLL